MANTDTSKAAPSLAPAEAATACRGLGFAVLCVQKAVEFSITDHKLHRATKDKELHEELEKLTDAGPSTFLYQLGGGCRVAGTCGSGGAPMSSACVGDSVAAFQGTLANLAELAQIYLPEPEEGPGTATPAELVCHMYLKVGVELLTKLRGRFAFCMYESKQGRVLAARDGSGAVHLYQGHSPSEGLVLSSTRAMLATCSDIKSFAPGDFKYGWHSEPRQFSSMEFGRRPSRSNHPAGPRRGSIDQASGGQRRSIDLSNMNHSHGSRRNSVDANAHHTLHSIAAAGLSNNSSRNGSERNHGRNRAAGSSGSGSSSNGDNTPSKGNAGAWKGASQQNRTPPLSPLCTEMKRLDVNATEFRPTWESSPAHAAPPAPQSPSACCMSHMNTPSRMATTAV